MSKDGNYAASDKFKKKAYINSLEKQGINVEALKNDMNKKQKYVNHSQRISK